jgi:hypothetical protein
MPKLIAKTFSIHEELSALLDKRGLLVHVAEETGTDYKRIHEIVSKKGDPGFVRGKTLQVWLECASMLAATRVDISKGRAIPFSRWCALDERRKELPHEVSNKIDCILELLSPIATLVRRTPAQLKADNNREQSYRVEAMEWVDSSISEMAAEIKKQLS